MHAGYSVDRYNTVEGTKQKFKFKYYIIENAVAILELARLTHFYSLQLPNTKHPALGFWSRLGLMGVGSG